MLLSDCMRNSSAVSRRRPCCLPQRLRPCCSGRCLLPVRSPCAKWTDGKRWQKCQPFNALTLLPEAITSLRWRCRYTNFYQLRDTASIGLPAALQYINRQHRRNDRWIGTFLLRILELNCSHVKEQEFCG